MMHAICAMLLLLTVCLLCLPTTGFACNGQKQAAQHSCCAKGQAEDHWCKKGQAQKQHTGQDCGGSCSDCCCQHLTDFTVLPVITSVKLTSRLNSTGERWSYSEDYSFTDFQLIWTPPKVADLMLPALSPA